jgi:hypothetical protein
MSGTNPSDVFFKPILISRPKADSRPHEADRALPVGVAESDRVEGSLSAAHVNRCMFLLLLICLAVAGSTLGVAGYLRSAQPSGAHAHLGSG